MLAIEAKRIADTARAKQEVRPLLAAIVKAAEEGCHTHLFGTISCDQVEAFRLLGYRIDREGPNVRVSWEDAKE